MSRLYPSSCWRDPETKSRPITVTKQPSNSSTDQGGGKRRVVRNELVLAGCDVFIDDVGT